LVLASSTLTCRNENGCFIQLQQTVLSTKG
jgi:hypothetical protein